MTKTLTINKILNEQRKSISLSLNQLSKLSDVSLAHLSRVEKGQRQPSSRILQRIAEPLRFDLYELLIMAGYLNADPLIYSKEHIEKFENELDDLLVRVISDITRIKQIVNRLILSKK